MRGNQQDDFCDKVGASVRSSHWDVSLNCRDQVTFVQIIVDLSSFLSEPWPSQLITQNNKNSGERKTMKKKRSDKSSVSSSTGLETEYDWGRSMQTIESKKRRAASVDTTGP